MIEVSPGCDDGVGHGRGSGAFDICGRLGEICDVDRDPHTFAEPTPDLDVVYMIPLVCIEDLEGRGGNIQNDPTPAFVIEFEQRFQAEDIGSLRLSDDELPLQTGAASWCRER